MDDKKSLRAVGNGGPAKAQGGTVLVVSLILLVLLSVIGVASLAGTSMQERMAANARLQTLAFEAASAGVADLVEWAFDNQADWPNNCSRGVGRWEPPVSGPEGEFDVQGFTTLNGPRVRISTFLNCFEDLAFRGLEDIPANVPLPRQLLGLSRGEVIDASGSVLASRDVEVRLERRGGDVDCLITTGPLGNITPPKSNSKSGGEPGGLDAGPGGCPMRTADEDSARRLRDALSDRVSRFRPEDPGIHTSELPALWLDADRLARAVNLVKTGIQGYQAWDIANLPDNPFASCQGQLHVASLRPNNRIGDVEICPSSSEDFVFVAGDLAPPGSGCNIEGLVIVEGTLNLNGNDQYQADILVLGGGLYVDGYGNAEPRGLLTLLNLESPGWPAATSIPTPPVAGPGYSLSDNLEMGASDFNINGMGAALITADDCNLLRSRRERLNECLADVREMVNDDNFGATGVNRYGDHKVDLEGAVSVGFPWALDLPSVVDMEALAGDMTEDLQFPLPNCDPEAAGGRRNVIASWREYIDRGRWDDAN